MEVYMKSILTIIASLTLSLTAFASNQAKNSNELKNNLKEAVLKVEEIENKQVNLSKKIVGEKNGKDLIIADEKNTKTNESRKEKNNI